MATPNETNTGNLNPVVNPEASQALDELFLKSTGEQPPADKPEIEETSVEPALPEKKPEVPVEPAPEKKPEVVPPVEPALPEKKPEPPATKKDALDEVILGPYAKPATTEAFQKVKTLARAELEKANAALTKAQQELEVLKKTPAVEAVTPEIKAEIEELRKLRRMVDIERDPDFQKTFNDGLAANESVIYSKLKEFGMADDKIEKIKKLGGPRKINWEPVFEKLEPSQKRLIEAKLIDHENILDKRKEAIEKAKEQSSEYFKNKEAKQKQGIEKEVKVLLDTANAELSKEPWTAKKEVPVAATVDERKAIEEHNLFVDATLNRVKAVLLDNSPEMKSIAAVGMAIGFKFKADAEKATARADKAEKELEKLRSAAVLRKPGSKETVLPVKKPAQSFEVSGSDALDDLFKAAQTDK